MTEGVFIATLGAEPQVVTLALDALLSQTLPITRVVVVHTDVNREPIHSAVQVLRQVFLSERDYGSLLFNLHQLAGERGPLPDVDTPEQVQMAFQSLYALLRHHKQSGRAVHLCIAGGRKTLTLAALLAAQSALTREDGLWHLVSAAPLLASRALHAPEGQTPRLIALPLLRDPDDRDRARQLYTLLSRAERQALDLLLAEGYSNAQIAARLGKSPRTIANQLTGIYRKTQEVFEMAAPPDRSAVIALLGRYS